MTKEQPVPTSQFTAVSSSKEVMRKRNSRQCPRVNATLGVQNLPIVPKLVLSAIIILHRW